MAIIHHIHQPSAILVDDGGPTIMMVWIMADADADGHQPSPLINAVLTYRLHDIILPVFTYKYHAWINTKYTVHGIGSIILPPVLL